MDNVDPQEYERFATDYRAKNRDAKDGKILLAYFTQKQKQQGKQAMHAKHVYWENG